MFSRRFSFVGGFTATLAAVAIVGAEGGVDGLSLVVPVVESPPGISFFFLDAIRR